MAYYWLATAQHDIGEMDEALAAYQIRSISIRAR